VTIAPPPQLLTIAPTQLPQGQTADIAITGLDTNFVNGTTVANLGAGVTVNGVAVSSPTQVTVNATIDANAAPGPRTVTLTTGVEVAARTDFFTVLAGLPEVTSILPAYGRRSTTVSVTVTGSNLLGAAFALRSPDPSFTGSAGTVTILSNTGTVAQLSIALGATEGQFQLAATTTLGASLPTPGSQFLIAPANGAQGSLASVLNTAYNDSADPSIPEGRNTATFYASVLNTSYNETADPSIPEGRNTATFYASVLNTSYNETADPSIPEGRNTATFYASVLNTSPDPSIVGAFTTAVALPVAVCNLASGCPAIPSSAFAPAVSSTQSPAAGSGVFSAVPGLEPPRLEPVDTWETVTEGQSILLIAREAGEGSTVEFEVNGVVVAALTEAPYETIFTVPSGVAELTFRIVVRDANGVERTSRFTRVPVIPDRGARIEGTALFDPKANREGLELRLAAGGLKSEFFDFSAPVTERPDLTDAKPSRVGYVTAVNQPNPESVFGEDPLGSGISPDFAVRYTGEVWVERTGPHRFWLGARSGASLALDGRLTLDTGFAAGTPRASETIVELDRGWHTVEIVYFHGVGPSSLRWEWQRPGDKRLDVVDQSHLRTELDRWTAVPDDEGAFSFAPVPAKFDTVWIRAVRGKDAREYPAVRPGSPDRVQIAIQH
jgi:hypothetical protein